MDAETIIFLVICAISIAGSVISAKNKAKQVKNDATYDAKTRANPYDKLLADLQAHDRAQQKEQQSRKEAHRRAHAKEKKSTRAAAQAPAAAQMQPIPHAVPEEGIRVTVSKKKEPAETPVQRTGLHDKENLKRAIIFGQILEPKF